jgi:hypothetical protein
VKIKTQCLHFWQNEKEEPSSSRRSGRISQMLTLAALIMTAYATDVFCQQHSDANNLFTAAGFAVRYADTPEKMAHLRRLPADKLVTRMRNGKMYYIYADPNICQCAYVGTPRAYQAYQAGAFGGIGGGGVNVEQNIEEAEGDDMSSVPGAPSFNDYVFGGIQDD